MTTTHYDIVRNHMHPTCVACSPSHPKGYGLRFAEQPDGSLTGEIDCPASLDGYPGLLHGGYISLIFDSAMVNCMFAHGYKALTAELSVKFMHPVMTGGTATVTAHVVTNMHPLYLVEAELTQDLVIRAKATAKFMVQDE